MRTRTLFLLVIAVLAMGASKRRAASPDRCSSTVAPASLSFSAAGGHATVDVNVTGGCSWSPVASDFWISVSPAGNQLSVDVAANTTASTRTGLIHVRGAVIVVTQAANPNLIQNPGFDNGLASWSEAFSGPGSASAASGSAVVTSTAVRSGRQLSQCVNITGGTRYEAGTRVLIPSGQSAGVINFGIFEYWESNCPVSPGYHFSRVLSANQPTGTWFDQNLTWTADLNARSVLVVIGAGGTDAPPFSAWFDDVYVRESR